MAQVSVDISGRLDDFGEDTVIGFSNDHQSAIRLPRWEGEIISMLIRYLRRLDPRLALGRLSSPVLTSIVAT